MTQFIPFLLFIVGLVIIIKGSNWFLDAVIWIAKIFKIPDIIVGATLVSICTTLPETMVSTSSALRGNTQMAIGNALGSIACNTGLILAVTIIFSKPDLKDRLKFQKKGLLLVCLVIFMIMVGFVFGQVTRFAGAILLVVLGWYLYNNIRESRISEDVQEEHIIDTSRNTVLKNILFFAVGLTLTIMGANILVSNGEIIARLLGIPDIIIGLTMTAFGTSLPELVTAIAAIRRNSHNIAVGNVLGANILNIILVIGLSSVIIPIPITQDILRFHLPFILFLVGSTVAFAFFNKTHFRRRNGFLLLCSYLIYMGLNINII